MTPEKKSIFREIADRLPADQRPAFWEMAAHVEKLPPDDEILRICQAMGVLTMVAQKIPSELVAERETWKGFCHEVTTRFETIIEIENLRSDELTRKVNGLVQGVSTVGQQVKKAAGEVKEALRQGADGFSTDRLEMAIRARVDDSVLNPAKETVQKSGDIVRQLDKAIPKFEMTVQRLENFNYGTAWFTAFLICGMASILAISFISYSISVGYNNAKEKYQASYEHNNQVLEVLDKTHHTINLSLGDDKFYITIGNADTAYMSTTNDGVIVLK